MTGFEVLAMAGMAASAAGSMASAGAQSAAYKANAESERIKAEQERAIGSYEQQQEQIKTQQTMAKEQAGIAASNAPGVSAARLVGATAGQGLYNQEIKGWQREGAARGYDFAAQAQEAMAKNAETTGYLRTGSTVLSGLTGMAQRNPSVFDFGSSGSGSYG